VITPALYQSLLAGETSRKTVVDLSVPNNVDKHILAHHPVQFIEIENLRATARENLAHRERERTKAEGIISQRIYAYRALWHERQVERSLAHIPDEVRAVKERAVNEVFGKEFAQLDTASQELMLKMLGYMEKKCVAIPMKAAKAIALHAQKQHRPLVSTI
jgi:glutamyl-tRNA reductase